MPPFLSTSLAGPSRLEWKLTRADLSVSGVAVGISEPKARRNFRPGRCRPTGLLREIDTNTPSADGIGISITSNWDEMPFL